MATVTNSIQRSSGRTIEKVSIGTVKSVAKAEGAGAAEPTFTATVTLGSNLLTAVSSFANIFVGAEVADETGKKFAKKNEGGPFFIASLNEAAKTITLNTPIPLGTVAAGAKILGVEETGDTFTAFNQVKVGSATEEHFPLYGPNYASADYFVVQSNVIEASGTPKLKVAVQASLDGINYETIGTEVAEQTAAGVKVAQSNIKEKVYGPYFRLLVWLGAAGGIAGQITVATGHTPYTSRG